MDFMENIIMNYSFSETVVEGSTFQVFTTFNGYEIKAIQLEPEGAWDIIIRDFEGCRRGVLHDHTYEAVMDLVEFYCDEPKVYGYSDGVAA